MKSLAPPSARIECNNNITAESADFDSVLFIDKMTIGRVLFVFLPTAVNEKTFTQKFPKM